MFYFCFVFSWLSNNVTTVSASGKGHHAFLPVGQRVLDKLTRLLERELTEAGAQKMSLPSLGPAAIWQKSGRWDIYGPAMYRLKDRRDNEFCLQPTCEEQIASLAAEFGVFKPASLPVMLFQVGFAVPDLMFQVDHPKVPRRRPARLRRTAGESVPDERPLFVRHRPRKRLQNLQCMFGCRLYGFS